MTAIRDLLVSGIVGLIGGGVYAGLIFATLGQPGSVFTDNVWFIFFNAAMIMLVSFVLMRARASTPRI
ncbi:MAG: hypothetical protein ACXACA_07335 [Candidatus Ranarchaeia archaeon]|jgi:hypothetical protein